MKNLGIIFFYLITLSLFIEGKAQTGFLEIDVWDLKGNSKIQIFQNDSLLKEFRYKSDYMLEDDESKLIKLHIGEYKINLASGDTIHQTVKNVIIKTDTITKVVFTNTSIYYTPAKDSIYWLRPIIAYQFLTGNNFINNNNNFNNYFDINFCGQAAAVITKHLSIGYQIGNSFGYTYFDRNNTLSSLENFDSEKYVNWDLNFSVLSRITAFNYKKHTSKGAYIDAGFSYNFPLIFRHVIKYGNTKVSKKNIHNFNDFSTTLRIGYSILALTYKYRLTSFLKDGFTEQPKITIGLSIFVPTDL
jgi:hypothetical protein